jgi:carboxylate-amine ligase
VVDPLLVAPLRTILERGPLARRMLAAIGESPDAAALAALQRRLVECLRTGSMFLG